MPLITTKVSTQITQENEVSLKSKYGKAIELINKSESWLMVEFQDNCRMYFKGDNAPSAMIEVDLFGKAADSGYDALTEKLTEIVEAELGIPKSRIYVKYSEIDHWGYSGFNF
jgi:phenylpyruvate tautomerase PptA (4-oxalocrotonate tautomerase family)